MDVHFPSMVWVDNYHHLIIVVATLQASLVADEEGRI